MYKKYNSKANSLYPFTRRSKNGGGAISIMAERLVPFLIIASTFVWLWK